MGGVDEDLIELPIRLRLTPEIVDGFLSSVTITVIIDVWYPIAVVAILVYRWETIAGKVEGENNFQNLREKTFRGKKVITIYNVLCSCNNNIVPKFWQWKSYIFAVTSKCDSS